MSFKLTSNSYVSFGDTSTTPPEPPRRGFGAGGTFFPDGVITTKESAGLFTIALSNTKITPLVERFLVRIDNMIELVPLTCPVASSFRAMDIWIPFVTAPHALNSASRAKARQVNIAIRVKMERYVFIGILR